MVSRRFGLVAAVLSFMLSFTTITASASASIVAIEFSDGFIGEYSNNSHQPVSIRTFNSLGIASVTISQTGPDSQFVRSTGNRIEVLLTVNFTGGATESFLAGIDWRDTTGSTIHGIGIEVPAGSNDGTTYNLRAGFEKTYLLKVPGSNRLYSNTAVGASSPAVSGNSATTGVLNLLNTLISDLDETGPVITGPSGGPGAASSTVSVPENQTVVTVLNADEPVSWSVAGGEDAAVFEIDAASGALSFNPAPDFEAPGDGPTQGSNTYILIVEATDTSANTSRQTVTVTVSDLDETEAPVFTMMNAVDEADNPAYNFTYSENQIGGTPLGEVLATASGVVTYSIISGNDSDFFNIGTLDGVLALTDAGLASFANDFEKDPNTHILEVEASAGTKQSSVQVRLLERDVDELALKLDEISDPLRAGLRRYVVGSLGDMLSFNETLMRDRNLSHDQCDAPAGRPVSGQLDATQDRQMAELGFARRLDDCEQWYRAYADAGLTSSGIDGNWIVRGMASVRVEADLDQSTTLGAGMMTSFAADRLDQFEHSRVSDESLQFGLYGRKQINERLRATGFAAFGGAWYDFELRDDGFALDGEMTGYRQVFGAALTGDIAIGSTVLTTDIILSHAAEDLGDAELDVIYLEDSRSDIDFEVGRVDVTRLSIPVSIPFELKPADYEGGDQVRLEISPGLLCEDISAHGSSLDCGYQAGIKLVFINGSRSYGYVDGSYERADDLERKTFSAGWARRFGPRRALEAGVSVNSGIVDGRHDAQMLFAITAAR